ncbi:MAG: DUF4340 domain-containing protein [Holophagales bacterium]|nr:DUF4340 domain-containing protein [Holophagales bacterium]
MKPKTLLVLTALALGLGAFIFFYEQDLASTDERQEAERKVLDLDAEDVTAVVLVWTGDSELGGEARSDAAQLEKTVRLEKLEPAAEGEGDGELGTFDPTPSWRITRPIEARADATDVRAFLDRVLDLEKSRTVEDIDPIELGFEPPRGAVTLTTDDRELRLEVGIELPLSGDLVVRRADVPTVAYQVRSATDLLDELGRTAGDWRDERLFTGMRGSVERIALEPFADDGVGEGGDGARILLVRRGSGEAYWLESPLVDRADTSEVNGLLNTLTGLEAEAFLEGGVGPGAEPDSAAETGTTETEKVPGILETGEVPGILETGEVPGTFETGEVPGTFEQGAFELGLRGQETPWRITLLGDGVAEVNGERVRIDDAPLRQALAKGAQGWRSRVWAPFQVFALEWARFDDGDGPFEARRDGGNWRRGDDEISYATATDALYPLIETRAELLLSPADARAAGFDLDASRLEVVLGTTSEEATLRLHGRAEHEGRTLDAATLEGRDAVLLLPSDKVDDLLEKVRELRTAEPITEDAEEEL